jgi:hypothetical protein
MHALLTAVTLFVTPLPAPAAPPCSEPHYRWREKTDTSLAGRRARDVDVTDILQTWTPRAITRANKCSPRAGREDSIYSVTGWVRRIKLREADQDWHIELTENEDDTPVSAACVIVEIPAPAFGDVYAQARAELAGFVDTLTLMSNGDLDHPVRLRFTGAAFFDGYHQEFPPDGGAPHASGHGRCNSSTRALWEIHPVYKVEAPEQP